MVSKYRLGNECEVWSETHFTMVTYVGDDGSVATLHFMPTVFIPTTYIGYSPTGTINSPLQLTTSTGATVSFPNLYADIKGIPWLFGGTAWLGTRYYKRESVYISDFFYWNPSGVGAGVEDINLGKDLRLSYGVFAVDGEPTSPGAPARRRCRRRSTSAFETICSCAGFGRTRAASSSSGSSTSRNLQQRSRHPWRLGRHRPIRAEGARRRQQARLPIRSRRRNGLRNARALLLPGLFAPATTSSESRIRVVEVLTIQPTAWLGAQVAWCIPA